MRNGISIAIAVWLLIGAFAAFQRGYFGGHQDVSCRQVSDTVLTIVAGPLNYFGANPKVDCAKVNPPQPSK
jgi:ABC-type dipeptide/oligopeptide/nickel transport system permease subunit